jgi:hypothetical protein
MSSTVPYTCLVLRVSRVANAVVIIKLWPFTASRFDSRFDCLANPLLPTLAIFGRRFESNRSPPHAEDIAQVTTMVRLVEDGLIGKGLSATCIQISQ